MCAPPCLVNVQIIIRPSFWSTLVEDQPSEYTVLSVLLGAMQEYAKEGDALLANQLARHGINRCLASLTPTALVLAEMKAQKEGGASPAHNQVTSPTQPPTQADEIEVDFSTATLAEVAMALGYQEAKDYRSQPPFTLTLRISGNGPSHVQRISLSYQSTSTPRVASDYRRTPSSSNRGASITPTSSFLYPRDLTPSPLTQPATSPAVGPSPSLLPSASPAPFANMITPQRSSNGFRMATPEAAPTTSASAFPSAASFFRSPAAGPSAAERRLSPPAPVQVAMLEDYANDRDQLQPESPPDIRDTSLREGAIIAADKSTGPFELETGLNASTSSPAREDFTLSMSPSRFISPVANGSKQTHPQASSTSPATVNFSPIQPRVSHFNAAGGGRSSSGHPPLPPQSRNSGERDFSLPEEPPKVRKSYVSFSNAPSTGQRSPDEEDEAGREIDENHTELDDLDKSGERTRPGGLMSWRGVLGISRGESPAPPPVDKISTVSHPLSTVPSRMQSIVDMEGEPGVAKMVEQLRLAMGSALLEVHEGEEHAEAPMTPAAARSLHRLVALVREGDEDTKLKSLASLVQLVLEQPDAVIAQLVDLQLPSLLVATCRGTSDQAATTSFRLLLAIAGGFSEEDRIRILSESGSLTYFLAALTSDRGADALACLEYLCAESPLVCSSVMALGGVRVLSSLLDSPSCPHDLKPVVVSVLTFLARNEPLEVARGPLPLQLVQTISYQAEDHDVTMRSLIALTTLGSAGPECLAALSTQEMRNTIPDRVNGILLVAPISLQVFVVDLMLVLMAGSSEGQGWIDEFSAAGSVKHLITPLRESDGSLTLKIARLLLCFTRSTRSRQVKSAALLSALAAAEKRAHTLGEPQSEEITHLVVALWGTSMEGE